MKNVQFIINTNTKCQSNSFQSVPSIYDLLHHLALMQVFQVFLRLPVCPCMLQMRLKEVNS